MKFESFKMGLCRIILLSSLIAFVSFVYFFIVKNPEVRLSSDVYKDQYWGKKVLKGKLYFCLMNF